MSDVVRQLRQDHANILKLLEALEHQVAAFKDRGGFDFDITEGVAEYFLTYPDHFHHPREDAIFRRLQAGAPTLAAKISDLLAEHEELSRLTHRFADTVHNILHEAIVPRHHLVQSAEEFIKVQRHHLEREEREFFPAALEVLSVEDWAAVDTEVAHVDDPLFGPQVEAEFQLAARNILNWDRMEAEG